jgi:hypothetical protein
MKPTFNDKLIAYLVLFSGLAISGVAEYYSIMGLMAIYPAALIPIVIMGVVLGIGKISGTVWLKQNWEWSPFFLKAYVLPAIIVLMLITSLGVFGFLSKAHSDQSLVSGDVQSKIAVYDEKIKTAKENIDANRKALKQMDESVDQVMGRSADEKGADKAVALRRGQAKERTRLLSEITAEQKTITQLSEERAPIAAEVRKVEAEVGPIKYIAHLLYGENPDANILEKAVIWVTVLIVIVLDPLAVVLLLASQYSFQRFREVEEADKNNWLDDQADDLTEAFGINDSGENPPKDDFLPTYEEITPANDAVNSTEPDKDNNSSELIWNKIIEEAEQAIAKEKEAPPIDQYAYLKQSESFYKKPEGWVSVPPQVYYPEEPVTLVEEEAKKYQIIPELIKEKEQPTFDWESIPADQEYVIIDGQNMHVRAAKALYAQTPKEPLTEVIEPEIKFSSYVQNEEQTDNTKWNRVISEAEYRDRSVTIHKNDDKDNTNNPA